MPANLITEIDGLDSFISSRSFEKMKMRLPLIVHARMARVGCRAVEDCRHPHLTNPKDAWCERTDAVDVVESVDYPAPGFHGSDNHRLGPGLTLRVWVVLMKRLGYTNCGARRRLGWRVHHANKWVCRRAPEFSAFTHIFLGAVTAST